MTHIKEARLRHHFEAEQVALILGLPIADYEQLEQNGQFSEEQIAKLAVLFRESTERLKSGPPKKKATAPNFEDQKEDDLLNLIAEIIVTNTLREVDREAKLKEFPDGYLFEETGYSCWICHAPAHGGWYDQHGLKCTDCQQAVNNNLIPGEITRDHQLYYTAYQLETWFGINPKAAKRFHKAGLLHPRQVGNRQTIYITSQQNNFLPPKTYLQESHWYQTVPDPIQHVKNYGIAAYLQFSDP